MSPIVVRVFPVPVAMTSKRAALAALKGLRHSADGFVLIGAFDDLFIDWRIFERLLVLADKAQPEQIVGGEETGNRARMRETNLPEKMM